MKSNACVKVDAAFIVVVVSFVLALDVDFVDLKFDLVVVESIVVEIKVECEGQYNLPNSVKEITSVGIPRETN
jgi:hypothetical protein